MMKDCTSSVAPKGDKFSQKLCPLNELKREHMASIPYTFTVGSLMYAQVCTRLDIAFTIGVPSKY